MSAILEIQKNQNFKIKEVSMIRRLMILGLVLAFLAGFTAVAFGNPLQTSSYDVKANIPSQIGFTVEIFRIPAASPTSWFPEDKVDFGELVWNATDGIFTSDYYYAVEVGFANNVLNWSIAHTTTPVSLGAQTGTANLDENINVTFIRQASGISGQELPDGHLTYSNSDGKAYSKAQIDGGWLRIYYGIATGDADDAPGAVPVTTDKPSGQYSGTVTLTLYDESI